MSISSIKFKMTVLVGLFAVFMLVVVGTTTYVVYSQSADARIIDIAGRQRMLTQKMFKDALVLVSSLKNSSATEEQREGLLKTISLCCVTKPFNREELCKEIEKLVQAEDIAS